MITVKEITTEVATLRFEDKIVVLTWKEDAEVDVDACVELVEIRRKHQQQEKALLLIDQRQFWSISKEAKEYSKQQEVEGMNKAIALLTGDSFPSIIVANTYIKLYKPNVPVKLFKTEEKARAWLLEQH